VALPHGSLAILARLSSIEQTVLAVSGYAFGWVQNQELDRED